VAGLLAALGLSVVIAEQQNQRFVPLTTYSSQPDGARALSLWLQEAGYTVLTLEDAPFSVTSEAGLLFVLEPSILYESAHLDTLERWVDQGGILVLGGSRLPIRPLLERFGLTPRPISPQVERAMPAQPLFIQPPIGAVAMRAADALEARTSASVPLLADTDRLVAVSLWRGKGRVIALASAFPFTNAGLPMADNAAFALHVVSLIPPGARIAFDEYHHGFIRREQRTALDLSLRTPLGWAGLYAGLLVLGYLAASGRRFGRAVPLAPDRRRGVAEYVRSMASLYRRAGQRRFVARHEAQQVRRRLARELGADPNLSLAELSEWLRLRDVKQPELLAVLQSLERDGPLSEAELVRLVQAATRLTEDLVRSRQAGTG
jgi:hypothetical protein